MSGMIGDARKKLAEQVTPDGISATETAPGSDSSPSVAPNTTDVISGPQIGAGYIVDDQPFRDRDIQITLADGEVIEYVTKARLEAAEAEADELRATVERVNSLAALWRSESGIRHWTDKGFGDELRAALRGDS